jgi:hypothetical protein
MRAAADTGREECFEEMLSFTQEKNIHLKLRPVGWPAVRGKWAAADSPDRCRTPRRPFMRSTRMDLRPRGTNIYRASHDD